MLWEVPGKEVAAGQFAELQLHEVLTEYDGPRIFILRRPDDELFLACFSDEDEITQTNRFVLVPFSDELYEKLVTGIVSVYEALDQPRIWVVDVSEVWKPVMAWRTALRRLPGVCLPEKNVMLWPSLEPIISVRSVGDLIGEGTTPASVIADVVDGVKRAMRSLVQQVREEIPAKASAAVRRLYDLPTQKFAFNSFEVSFRLPAEDTQTQLDGMHDSVANIYRDVSVLLNKGIQWLQSGNPDPTELGADEQERDAILEALEHLIPSTIGPVKSLEVSGSLVAKSEAVSGGPIHLTKESKSIIRLARKILKLEQERVYKAKGYIRELDKDRYTFELRDNEIRTIGKFSFDQEIADDVNDAHYNDYPVEIVVQGGASQTKRARIVQKLDAPPENFAIEPV